MLQWFNLIYKCMWIFNVKNRIHCKELCNFKLIELQWYWLSIYLYAWIDFAIVLIRFTNFEDQAWFNKTMSRVINEELSETHGAMVDSTHYFVDFMKWVTFPMQPLFGLHDLRVTSPWLSFCSFFIFFPFLHFSMHSLPGNHGVGVQNLRWKKWLHYLPLFLLLLVFYFFITLFLY